MFIGSAREIADAIGRLTESHGVAKPIQLAIAFWGSGAEEMIRSEKRYRIVCNLTSGGTNPAVVRQLRARRGLELRHLSNLHAKVAVFEQGAIISSANFSTNGLGLEGEAVVSWEEAGCELPHDADNYVHTGEWFDRLWAKSAPISDQLLEAAEVAWAKRSRASLDDKSVIPDTAPSDSVEEPPLLAESDLFEQKLKRRNKIRMAAPWLVRAFSKIEKVNKNSRYVPAYVANIIWTQSGGSIATNIPENPVFSSPAQVVSRALDRSKKHGPRILSLLSLLVDDRNTPPPVQYWAAKSLEMMLNKPLPPILRSGAVRRPSAG